jgi:hypothetical protein
LPGDATPDAIRARFIDLVRQQHPDTGEGGDLAELVAVRDAALGNLPSSSRELAEIEPNLPDRVALELEKLRREVASLRSGAEVPPDGPQAPVQRTIARITATYMSRYRTIRRRAEGAAAAFAVLAGASYFKLPGSFPYRAGAAGFLAVLAAIQLLRRSLYNGYSEKLKEATEDAHEALSDASTYVDLLYELTSEDRSLERWLRQNDRAVDGALLRRLPPWTRAELEEVVARWIEGSDQAQPAAISLFRELIRDLATVEFRFHDRRIPLREFAAIIGVHDFSRLLIEEGLAQGLLVRKAATSGSPGSFVPAFELA